MGHRLLAEVAARGLTLEKILLTHGHLDHVGAAAELRDALGIPIIGPQREEQFWLDALPQQAEMFGFPPLLAFTPDQWLEDGDTVEVGSIRFEVLHCPGHTPGHVVFYQPEARLAFVGDVLFKGSIGLPGHGAMSTFGHERRDNPFVGEGAEFDWPDA